jgi:hypothetical protein
MTRDQILDKAAAGGELAAEDGAVLYWRRGRIPRSAGCTRG